MINWKEIVEPAIERVIKEFQAHPFAFLWESDVQSLAWSYIDEMIPKSERYKKGLIDWVYHRKPELTTVMHPLMFLAAPEWNIHQRNVDKGMYWGRFFLDIGIWDTEHPDFVTKDYRDKPVRMGIEFKINEEPVVTESITGNFVADVYKLTFLTDKFAPVFTGYALWFLPNVIKDFPKRRYNSVHKALKNNTKVIVKAITPTKIIDFNHEYIAKDN